MYEAYYGLRANPFRLAPDPQFFYESSCHKRGLAYLRYGLHQGQGFVVVTGVPGTGKSLLVQTIFAELAGRRMVVASINNTNLNADDILYAVANSFDVYCGDTTKAALLSALERFLIERNRQGKRVLLIVDEAQNLPQRSLEELRMLSNFQSGDQPLLQIMLLGQQQLQAMLADPNMEQLTQRVIASCHLKPLELAETRGYIEHRLRHVGWCGKPGFSGEALGLIHYISHGIPRLINTFCDRLLLAAYLDQKTQIDADHVRGVLHELQNEATGAWQGIAIAAAPATALAPLPDGEFVAGQETAAVVTKLEEKEPTMAEQQLQSFRKSLHADEKAPAAAVAPISKAAKPHVSNKVVLSGRKVVSLAHQALAEQRDELESEVVKSVAPLSVASLRSGGASFSSAPAIKLHPAFVPERAGESDEPPAMVYRDRDAMIARRWWFAIGIMALIVIVTLLILMFDRA